VTDLALAALLTAVLVVASRSAPAPWRRAVPAAVLGGGLALVVRQFGVLPGSVAAWQDVGYHLFGASFLAIGLTPSDSSGASVGGGAAWMGVGQWVSFPVQAVVGGLLTWGFIEAGGDLHPAFGFLAPMGLNEGPGQAVSIGRLWEAEGLVNAPSIGATMASLGFVMAYAGGVIVARRSGRLRRRGAEVDVDVASAASGTTEPAVPTPDAAVRAGSTTAPSGPDRRAVAVTAAAVAAGYVAIYWLVRLGTGLIGEEVQDLVLAVLFFVCLLVGMGVRALLGRRGVRLDGDALRTVTVWAVDGLTIAILGSLAWDDVSGVAVELLSVVVLAVAATGVAIWLMGRRLPSMRLERQLALFGTVTGTAASGLALISMVDPDMESTASTELGAAVVVSTPVVLGGIAITSLAATGRLSLLTTVAVLSAVAVVAGVVQRFVVRRLRAAGS
jgi:ESS family glutamate:Na+ symporter